MIGFYSNEDSTPKIPPLYVQSLCTAVISTSSCFAYYLPRTTALKHKDSLHHLGSQYCSLSPLLYSHANNCQSQSPTFPSRTPVTSKLTHQKSTQLPPKKPAPLPAVPFSNRSTMTTKFPKLS